MVVFDSFAFSNAEGAADTHLSNSAPLRSYHVATPWQHPVSVTGPVAPMSGTLTFQGVVCEGSSGGEVTLSTDALASCVSERSHEAIFKSQGFFQRRVGL